MGGPRPTARPSVHTVREGSPVDANLSNRCTLSASVGSHPRVGHSMMYSSESRRRGPATSGPGRARRHPVTRARSPRKEQGPHRCVRANSAATAEALPRRTRVRRRCSESGSARPVLFNDGDMPPLNDEHVARPERAHAAVESRPVVADAGREVMVERGRRRRPRPVARRAAGPATGSRPPSRRGCNRSACVVNGRLRYTDKGAVRRAPPCVVSRV